MTTFTNEISINCNFKAIDKQFDIFQIKSSNKYIQKGSKVLDLGLNCIKSIAFDDGASVFLLLVKHSIKSFELQGLVGDDLMVKKLDANELKPYILARMLLFALSSSNYEEFAFSNLTGKLYLFKSEWISSSRKYFKSLNIDIKTFEENSAKIICSACTFTSTKLFKSPKIIEKYPRYIFSIKGTLKRVFEKDDNSYIKRTRDGKKAEIPFLSFFKDKMKLCKAYLLHLIIDKFNEIYKGLAEIKLREKEIVQKIETRKDEPFFDKVVERLIGKTINLVDMDKATEDEETFNNMVFKIQEMLPLTNIVVSKVIKTKEMNIVLIHNRDYYIDNDLKDPYCSFDRSTPIQCVTLEDACFKDSDVIYKTIIKELEIKNEIINERKFLIDDWKAYQYSKSFIFGIMINSKAYFMNVSPSGTFNLIKKSNVFSCFKEKIYNELEKILFNIKNDEKLIVADDVGNVNIISDSGLISLSRKELFISNSPRSNESKRTLLAGILDINIYQEGEVVQYSVGPIGKTLNASIPTAPHIYNVLIKTGREIMTNLIETLGVQFVKYNSFTITPYPFKYLREWILMNV